MARDRDSRSRAGAAPRRHPSDGVAVVRRAGRCNAAAIELVAARCRERPGGELPVTGPLRNGVEWSWR